MISDQEQLQGAAIVRLLRECDSAVIAQAGHIHTSLFLIDSCERSVGVLFKLNTAKQRSPWQFTFTSAEAAALSSLKEDYPSRDRFVALVCKLDGICCVAESLLLEATAGVLCGNAVSVSRPKQGSYHITGPSKWKSSAAIPMNAWPREVLGITNKNTEQ